MKFFVLLIILAFVHPGFAETQYSLSGDYRTYPRGLGLTADYNYSDLLSGEKKEATDFMYSFYRLGAKAAVHGQAEVYADYFPISILQLGIARSWTYRFYDSDQMDCDGLTCREILSRTTLKANLVLGYGSVFAVLGVGKTKLGLSKENVFYGIESETLVAGPNDDELRYSQMFLGIKRDNDIYGLYSRAAHVQQTADDSQASYFIFRKKLDENWGVAAGAGFFKSGSAEENLSAFLGASWTAGETLSLF